MSDRPLRGEEGACPTPILAIDTSAGQCAAAVVAGGASVHRRQLLERGHAELLFSFIDEALAEAGFRYRDLGRIVCCTGPGSFVGTRIGVASARGLALGLGCPAVGVSRFEALAAEAQNGREAAVGVLLEGRGGTVFFQPFGADGAGRAPPRIIAAATPEAELLDGLELLAGDGALHWDALPRHNPAGLPDPTGLARLGADRAAAPPAPLYLRPPAADLPREVPPRLLD